jgi:hypothetical protein
MNRPLGVTIIALLNIFFGLIGICVGMVTAMNAMLVGMSQAVGANILSGSLIVVVASAVAVFIVLLNGIQFYVGIGLLLTQKWAHLWARILAGIAIAAGVVQVVVGLLGGTVDIAFPIGTGLNSIVIQAIVLIYLSRQGMRDVFVN